MSFWRNSITTLYNLISAPVASTHDALVERLQSVRNAASLLYTKTKEKLGYGLRERLLKYFEMRERLRNYFERERILNYLKGERERLRNDLEELERLEVDHESSAGHERLRKDLMDIELLLKYSEMRERLLNYLEGERYNLENYRERLHNDFEMEQDHLYDDVEARERLLNYLEDRKRWKDKLERWEEDEERLLNYLEEERERLRNDLEELERSGYDFEVEHERFADRERLLKYLMDIELLLEYSEARIRLHNDFEGERLHYNLEKDRERLRNYLEEERERLEEERERWDEARERILNDLEEEWEEDYGEYDQEMILNENYLDCIGNEEECSICYDSVNSPAVSCKTCKKEYHLPCLKQWLQNSKTCPTCRQ